MPVQYVYIAIATATIMDSIVVVVSWQQLKTGCFSRPLNFGANQLHTSDVLVVFKVHNK
jgi:G3E family GTPase